VILVINEWIFEDLIGENGPDKFKETAEFVLRAYPNNPAALRAMRAQAK
jgi:hypothetical protein